MRALLREAKGADRIQPSEPQLGLIILIIIIMRRIIANILIITNNSSSNNKNNKYIYNNATVSGALQAEAPLSSSSLQLAP